MQANTQSGQRPLTSSQHGAKREVGISEDGRGGHGESKRMTRQTLRHTCHNFTTPGTVSHAEAPRPLSISRPRSLGGSQPLQPPQPPEPPQPPLPPQPPQPPQPPLPKLPPQLAIPFITPIQHPQPLKKKVRGVRKEPLLQTAPYGPTVQVTAYKGAQDSAPNSTPDPAAIPWASSTVPAAQQPCPAGHGHAPQPAAAPQDKALILPKLAEDRGEWSLPAGYKASLFRLLEMLPLSPQRLERAKSQLQAHLDAQRQLQNEVILPGYAWLLAAVSSKDASSILACLRRKFHIEL